VIATVFIFLLSLVATGTGTAQQPPTEEFNKTFGGTSLDEVKSVIEISDGGFALAGETESFGAGDNDAWLIKTDSNGNVEISETFGGTDYDSAESIVETSYSGYALGGFTHSFGPGDTDAWLVKISGSSGGNNGGKVASPGGQVTVSVQGKGIGSVTVSDIPNGWSVAGSQNDGAFITPDGEGDGIKSHRKVLWAWSDNQSSVDVSVTLDIHSSAQTGDYTLTVEEEGVGNVDTETRVVTLQNCPVDPVVCNYGDSSGNVDLQGLQQAIDDFVNDRIDLGTLQNVVDEFVNSR